MLCLLRQPSGRMSGLCWSLLGSERLAWVADRDRGAPHGAAPPTPPGVRVAYHGGSIGLCWGRNVESGETD